MGVSQNERPGFPWLPNVDTSLPFGTKNAENGEVISSSRMAQRSGGTAKILPRRHAGK